MRKFYSGLFVVGICILLLAAVAPASYAQADASTTSPPDSGLLWQISGNGLAKASYLFGTASAVCPQELQLGNNVLMAIEKADNLVLTLNITDLSLSTQILQAMQLPTGQNISQWFTQAEYQMVDRFYQDSLGISLQNMGRYQPLFVSSYLFGWVLACPALSYEQELARQFGMQNKPISGLETVEDQGNMFRKIPYRNQAKLLAEAVKDPDRLKAFYTDMVVSYRNQDLPSLYTIGKELSLGTTAYEDVLLRDRNRNWVPRIEQSARESATFFAVGAPHLAGPDGLIALLKRRGYTVKPAVY